jgi:hypothetical protein
MCHGVTVLVRAVWKVNVSSLSPVAPFNGDTGRFGELPHTNIPERAILEVRLTDVAGPYYIEEQSSLSGFSESSFELRSIFFVVNGVDF